MSHTGGMDTAAAPQIRQGDRASGSVAAATAAAAESSPCRDGRGKGADPLASSRRQPEVAPPHTQHAPLPQALLLLLNNPAGRSRLHAAILAAEGADAAGDLSHGMGAESVAPGREGHVAASWREQRMPAARVSPVAEERVAVAAGARPPPGVDAQPEVAAAAEQSAVASRRQGTEGGRVREGVEGQRVCAQQSAAARQPSQSTEGARAQEAAEGEATAAAAEAAAEAG